MLSVCLGLIFTLLIHFLRPFLFLIYINDLSNDIKSKCKFFADKTSLFFVVYDIDASSNDLNHDLEKTSE